MLNAARLGKRQAGMNGAAPHRPIERAAPARAMSALDAWIALRRSKPGPAERQALVEAIILA